MKKVLLFLSIQLLFCAAFAQNFKYKAKVKEVNKDGFFKIQLSPEIVAKSKYRLADLRLTLKDGTEIPFILTSDPALFYEQDFVPFSIEENTNKGNTQTIVINNKNNESITNLVLEMKNFYGEKKIRISGSDDKKNWFMLHQGFTFTVPGDANSTKIYQAIDFPKSDYKWFSISLMDTMPLSLNILRIGNYKQKVIFGNYSTVSVKNFSQKDSSDKKSYVRIGLKEPNVLDKLKVFISYPDQYLRNGQLQLNYLHKDTGNGFTDFSSGRYNNGYQRQTISLNSDLENSFSSSEGGKISSLLLIVYNNDNQPLQIDSIQLQQLKTYLIARLETGKKYYLEFGDSSLNMPEYDLKYFENKIPKDIQIINHLGVEANKTTTIATKEKALNTKVFIWIGLLLAGLLLAYMTNKMLREIKKTAD